MITNSTPHSATLLVHVTQLLSALLLLFALHVSQALAAPGDQSTNAAYPLCSELNSTSQLSIFPCLHHTLYSSANFAMIGGFSGAAFTGLRTYGLGLNLRSTIGSNSNKWGHLLKPLPSMKWLPPILLIGSYLGYRSLTFRDNVFFSKTSPDEDSATLGMSYQDGSSFNEPNKPPPAKDPYLMPYDHDLFQAEDVPSHHKSVLASYGAYESWFYKLRNTSLDPQDMPAYPSLSNVLILMAQKLESIRLKFVIVRQRLSAHTQSLSHQKREELKRLLFAHVFHEGEWEAMKFRINMPEALQTYQSSQHFLVSFEGLALKLLRLATSIERFDYHLSIHAPELVERFHPLNKKIAQDLREAAELLLGFAPRLRTSLEDSELWEYLFHPLVVSLESSPLPTFQVLTFFEKTLGVFSKYLLDKGLNILDRDELRYRVAPQDVNLLLRRYSKPSNRLRLILAITLQELISLKESLWPELYNAKSHKTAYEHTTTDDANFQIERTIIHLLENEELNAGAFFTNHPQDIKGLTATLLGIELLETYAILKRMSLNHDVDENEAHVLQEDWQQASPLWKKEFIHQSLPKFKVSSQREKREWLLGDQLLTVFLNLQLLRAERLLHAKTPDFYNQQIRSPRDRYLYLDHAAHQLWGRWGNSIDSDPYPYYKYLDQLVAKHGIIAAHHAALRKYIPTYPYLAEIRRFAAEMGEYKRGE